MFGLDNLFAQTSAQKFYISRDRIAEILRVSPDALDAFEKAYSKAALQTCLLYTSCGGGDSFSVVRGTTQPGFVEVDGRLMDYEDFEAWLYQMAA